MFVDAWNVLNATNLADIQQGTFPNPYIGATDYLVHYTQTGRAGGAHGWIAGPGLQ